MTSMTVLEDIVAQLGTQMVESRKDWAKSREELFNSHREMDRILTGKISSLSDSVSEMSDSISGLSEELDKWIGYFGNNIGYLVEMILIPGIKSKINAFGHNFNNMSARKKYAHKGGKRYAEVDLFLEDGNEVMAVEVKTRLEMSDVKYHVKRLKLLRDNESESGLTGKTLYAAVAGLDIDDDAREMALNLGMYVVEMVESTKHVNVIKPSVELGKW